MDNRVTIFKNEEFGSVRIVTIDGEPWFVGKDVAEALGYGNSRQALKTNVDEDDRGVHPVDTPSGIQDMTVINESGLYSLVLSSKLASAKRFKKWVTSEVIPSIRKNGAYMTRDTLRECLCNPDAVKEMLAALSQTQEENTRLSKVNQELTAENKELTDENVHLSDVIESQKDDVEFSQHVQSSDECVDMGVMAKIISKNGVTIGRNNLFKLLRDNRILMSNNAPYQKYMDAGWFILVERTRIQGAFIVPYVITYVTGKGQVALVKMVRKMYGLSNIPEAI